LLGVEERVMAEDIERVLADAARLVREFDPEEVILFGSRAWGRPAADSDVDLMVIVSEIHESPTRRIRRAYDALDGIRTAIDVLVKTRAEFDKYADVRAALTHKIREHGRVLYAR
jgi:predicted nucleotidyltransferase